MYSLSCLALTTKSSSCFLGAPRTRRVGSRLGQHRVRRLLQDAALSTLLVGLALEQDVSLGTPLGAPRVLDLPRGETQFRTRGAGQERKKDGVVSVSKAHQRQQLDKRRV